MVYVNCIHPSYTSTMAESETVRNCSSKRISWAAQFCHRNDAASALDTFPTAAKVAHSKNSPLRESERRNAPNLLHELHEQKGLNFSSSALHLCVPGDTDGRELDPWTLTSAALWKPRPARSERVCWAVAQHTDNSIFLHANAGRSSVKPRDRSAAVAAASMHPGVNNAQAEAAAPQDCCVNACGQSQDLSPHRTK